ncbi:hypothetical protein TNCV_2168511 [Trichonephila clavipes]|nr:hypothetical protein TNCV_2168511 [Trichonephila clavipes]
MHGFSQLFRYNVHLEIATEKKHKPTRAFCDDITNLRNQVARVKRKASVSDEAVERAERKSTRVTICELATP